MARRRGKQDTDRGRNFYETSSPFETYTGDNGAPKTYTGLTDKSVAFPKNLHDTAPGRTVMSEMHPEQYDNPRGFPGLALIQTGSEKPKLPIGKHSHTIQHHTESQGKLARTGK